MSNRIEQRFFARMDDSDDELFYAAPRKAVHIDNGAIASVGEILSSRLPRDAAILDLMSSWRSHLPPLLNPKGVVGLGMNREEMEDNPALTEIVIHNLNREPRLPFGDNTFDAAMLTVSVQYLIHPIEVFADTGRVLRPDAPFVVSLSNRMFPTKAVALWMEATEDQRVSLVEKYFVDSGAFRDVEVIDKSGRPGPPCDPIWAVVGYRLRKEIL